MKYSTIYDSLIENAKLRKAFCKHTLEKHHIVPKSLGGSNRRSNIVFLTFKEHLVAHLLLIRMFPEQTGMVSAALRLLTDAKDRGSKGPWTWVKTRAAKIMSERAKRLWAENAYDTSSKDYSFMHTEEFKEKQRAGIKRAFADGNFAKQQSQRMKQLWQNEEYAEQRNKKTSETMKAKYADPMERERRYGRSRTP